MMAVFGLINFSSVKHAMQVNKHDGIASIVTFVATIGLAPHLDQGILLGASLAIGLYLYRTMSPRIAFLGRHPDGTLRDVNIYDNLPVDERIIAVRFDGTLYFANVSYFEDTMLKAVATYPEAKDLLVVGDASKQIDASGEEVLHHLFERLQGNNMTVVFSGLKRQILLVMKASGLYEIIGEQNIFSNEDFALDEIYKRLELDASGEACPLKRQLEVNPETV